MQIDVFVEWVNRQNPDIIFYQELNGWSEEEFAELAQRCGHKYAAKIKEDGYRMGLSSRFELRNITRYFFADDRRTHDKELKFDVTNTLLEAGFIDAYKSIHTEYKTSFPTAKCIFPGEPGVRIDYAFLSPILKSKCTSAEIIHDPITRFLSDHYPLVITLQNGVVA